MADLADLSSIASIFGTLANLGAPQTTPTGAAVGAPIPTGAGYVMQPDGSQDVVDATLYVASLPVVGDPVEEMQPISDAELNMMFGQALGSVNQFDTVDFMGGFRQAFGGPQMAQLRQSFPELAGYGGPLDSIANFFTSASEKTLGALGAATKGALAALNKSHTALATRVATGERNQKSREASITRRLTNVESTARQLSTKWNQYNGTQSRYQRLILTVSQSWPGIKANRMIHDVSLVEFFAIFKRFFAAIEAKITATDLELVPTAGAAYVQADANATISAIVANQTALRDDLDAIIGMLNELAAGVIVSEASKKSAATFHSYISNRSLLDQLAEVMPSSIQDKTQAMWEAGIKYVGPRPQAAGAGLLAGLGL
jgi:hypothetical protein